MSSSNPTFVKTFSRCHRHPETAASQAAQAADPPTQIEPVAGKITRVDQGQPRTAPTQQRTAATQPQPTAYQADVLDPSMLAPPPMPAASTVVEPSSPDAPQPQTAERISPRFDSSVKQPPAPHYRSETAQEVASTQTAPAVTAIERFQAAWEVDVFDVPPRVADLFFEGRRFSQIAERVSAAVQTGLRSMLITSASAGEGRSSVAVGIAMAAAASGVRVALIDGDTEKPTLAESLRLDIQHGWIDSIRNGLPIREAAVHAVEDGVTLIPLIGSTHQSAATPYETSRLIEQLQGNFDLIIIDGPAQDSADMSKLAPVLDSVIIVRDVNRTASTDIERLAERLKTAGIQGIGVVDNFT